MVKTLIFVICLLTAVIGNLYLENREVRKDQDDIARVYVDFLKRKAGGKTLGSRLALNSLAVFRSQNGYVGCAMMEAPK
jgi:hypothetical protein